jgi:hypothetical protein
MRTAFGMELASAGDDATPTRCAREKRLTCGGSKPWSQVN